jgi:acyl transferase domain-containing protein
VRTAAGVAKDLADSIAHGVCWHEATSVALEPGCALFLEAPPEHVLTDLARDNLDRMQAWPVTPGDFQRLLSWRAEVNAGHLTQSRASARRTSTVFCDCSRIAGKLSMIR